MVNSNRIAIVLTALLVVFGVLLLVISQNSLKHSWAESFDLEGMEPYDLGLLSEILNETPGTKLNLLSYSITEKLPEGGNYLFIGPQMFMNEAETDSLFNFVKRGNDAFIATEQLPFPMMKRFGLEYGQTPTCTVDTFTLYYSFEQEAYPNDTGNIFFAFTYNNRGWEFYRKWCDINWLSRSSIDSIADSTEVLGRVNYHDVGFLRIQLGDGNIYLYTNPIIFTNYFLKEEAGYEHAMKCFSKLESKPFYFDQFSRNPHNDVYPPTTDSSTPMKYVFSQPALRQAWYLVLGGMILFLLFRSKREQRIIPIVPKVENTSIEFAKALGTLYMQSNSPRHLAQEMMTQFHNHNRRTYGIQRQKKGWDMADLIATKSKVAPDRVRKIFQLEGELLRTESEQINKVVPLYQELQYYYQNARK